MSSGRLCHTKERGAGIQWLLAAYLLSIGAIELYAQGTIDFRNRSLTAPDGSIYHAPVYVPDCVTLVSGDGFRAQLYAARTGSSESALMPVTPALEFRSGVAAGFWNPLVLVVPFIPVGERALVQVRVWETAAGSYENAAALGLLHGRSEAFETQHPLFGFNDPGLFTMMNGLQSFCLIPEPSISFIALLGGAAIFGLRCARRQSLTSGRRSHAPPQSH